MSIPDDILTELAFLNAESAKVRGYTPLDDPARKAGDAFCKLVLATVDNYGVTYEQLSRLLGLSNTTIRLKLGRRGYAKSYPSQPDYKGVKQAPGAPRKSVCKRGHDLTSEGTRRADGRCKACATASDRARYAAKQKAGAGYE